MSDEESFVILGSTPTPSMEAYSSVNDVVNRSNPSGTVDKSLLNISEAPESGASWLKSSNDPFVEHGCNGILLGATTECQSKESITTDTQHPIENLDEMASVSNNDKPNSIAMPLTSAIAVPESLADKYLLGKIDKNEMKMYMSNTFPSLFGKDSHQEDVQKLQQLLIDHEVYKNQILKMNKKLEHLVDVIQVGDEKRKREIEKVREEKNEMQREMQSQIEAIKISEQQLQQEYNTLVQNVSEGKSIMSNMGAQLERLELQQHDMSIINVSPISNEQNNQVPMKSDAASKKIKDLERQLSEVIAENYDLKDMRKIYVDEIDCLKVNLTSAEELLRQAQSDITYLKGKDTENSEKFTLYESERDAMKQEIGILKHQLEVYRSDFEIERSARQELAGQRDQTLTDLQLLQKRNQLLMEENDRLKSPAPLAVSAYATPSRQSPPAQQSISTTNFVCPICNKTFRSLPPLEMHVQSCLAN